MRCQLDLSEVQEPHSSGVKDGKGKVMNRVTVNGRDGDLFTVMEDGLRHNGTSCDNVAVGQDDAALGID